MTNDWKGLPLPIRNEMIRRTHGLVQREVMDRQLDYGEICTVVLQGMVEGFDLCRTAHDTAHEQA